MEKQNHQGTSGNKGVGDGREGDAADHSGAGQLKSSRDLAVGEAARAEEQAIWAREQLRDVEGRLGRARARGGGEGDKYV